MTEDTLRKLQESELTIRSHMARMGYELSIYNPERQIIVDDFSFKEVDPSAHFVNLPVIPDKMAQQLMDQLWSCGVRPSGELDSIGHREALESHLNDMRRIVSAELDVDL